MPSRWLCFLWRATWGGHKFPAFTTYQQGRFWRPTWQKAIKSVFPRSCLPHSFKIKHTRHLWVMAVLPRFFCQSRRVSAPLAVRWMKQKQSKQETLLLENRCQCLRRLQQLCCLHNWPASPFDVTMSTAAFNLLDLCILQRKATTPIFNKQKA